MNGRLQFGSGLSAAMRNSNCDMVKCGKRESEPKKIRQAVREACLDEFRRIFGKEWNPRLEICVRTDGNTVLDWSREKRALKVFRELKSAISQFDAFVSGTSDDAPFGPYWEGAYTQLLVHLGGRRMLEPIKPYLKNIPPSKLHNDSRSIFVFRWDYMPPINLPRRKDGTTRFLTPRELAVISLLGGHWPDSQMPNKMPRASEVIAAEEEIVRLALRKHGVQRFRLIDGRLVSGKGLHHDLAVSHVTLAKDGDEFVPRRGPDQPVPPSKSK
ncbi:MAG TPA: hypothetical protein VKP30_30600 [Polyangiaceae bacterium]|nr:hypothetical protein [Polyangiaceae bacterium]